MIPIRLNWQRPRDGVEIVLGDNPRDSESRRIVPRSDRADPIVYRVSNLENPIALHLINCTADADLVAFVARFGFPYEKRGDGQHWDTVGRLYYLRDDIDGIIDLARYPNSLKKTVHANELIRHVALRPTFECTEAGQNRLIVEAVSLEDLIMMEAVFAIESGASLTRCAHCSKAFLYGPHTGRRSHSVYCCDRCRVAAMRARNAARKVL